MKILIALTIVIGLFAGCSSSSSSSGPKVVYKGGGLKELQQLTGKRVREVELWDAADMSTRLGKLLGAEFENMKQEWVIESSIVADGNVLMAAGCEMNNCDRNQWILFADAADDNINVYHIKDGSMKAYKEKGDVNLPQEFADAFARMKAVQDVK